MLFTIEIARLDPRLFDEILDWLATNGWLLSLTRLKYLERRHPGDANLVHAALAWASQASSTLHWHIPTAPRASSLVDVFDEAIANFIPEPDPTFAAYGFRRPPARRSGKSEPPDYRLPINFAFQLRSLFGIGTRPEAVRTLLTRAEPLLDAATIAREAGFTKRNVSEALTALADARVIKARFSGHKRVFTIYRDKWALLLGHGPKAEALPRFAPWIPLLRTLTALHVWLEHHHEASWSTYMAASQIGALIDSLATDLEELAGDLADNGNLRDGMGPPGESGHWERLERLVTGLLDLAETAPSGRQTA